MQVGQAAWQGGAMRRRKWWKWLWSAVAVGVAFGLGAWRGTMAGGESVHFAINYPAKGKDLSL